MKRSPVLLLAGLGLLAVLVPNDAAATVLVSTSDLAPVSYFAHSTERAGGVQWRNSSTPGLRDPGQSFYVENDPLLDSIPFRLGPDAAPGAGALTAAFHVSIYEIAAAGSVPFSEAFYTDSGTMTGLTGTPADFSKYVTFDLNDVALQGGKSYTFNLSFPTRAVERQATFPVSGAAPDYTGGMVLRFRHRLR
jgi:hypothetical protein